MPGGWHQGDPSDWADPTNADEENERAAELFVREFGPCTGRVGDFVNASERRIRRESPEIGFAELVKRISAALRTNGFGRS